MVAYVCKLNTHEAKERVLQIQDQSGLCSCHKKEGQNKSEVDKILVCVEEGRLKLLEFI